MEILEACALIGRDDFVFNRFTSLSVKRGNHRGEAHSARVLLRVLNIEAVLSVPDAETAHEELAVERDVRKGCNLIGSARATFLEREKSEYR